MDSTTENCREESLTDHTAEVETVDAGEPHNYFATWADLVKRLASIQEVRQRSFAVSDRLNKLEPADAVRTIALVIEQALAGDRQALAVYGGLLVPGMLAEVMGQAKVSQLIAIAQDTAQYEVAALLLEIPPKKQLGGDSQPFLDSELREVPLGVRKALARKPDFHMIQRIARDQDPRVIENLLNNPRLTEQEVVRLASTRPASAHVLRAVYAHPRWINRYALKKVIVLNPYSPVSLALRLLAYLSVQDLEEVTASTSLGYELRAEAGRILEKKSAGQAMDAYFLSESDGALPEDLWQEGRAADEK